VQRVGQKNDDESCRKVGVRFNKKHLNDDEDLLLLLLQAVVISDRENAEKMCDDDDDDERERCRGRGEYGAGTMWGAMLPRNTIEETLHSFVLYLGCVCAGFLGVVRCRSRKHHIGMHY
jgi:hypothetical protein